MTAIRKYGIKNELISVVIPTYNRAYCIENAIQSVLAQTYSDIEVIVIDDASNDATRRVIEKIADSRVRYYLREENCGAAAARNLGVSYAHGSYIAFHDSDDSWLPDKLKKQMQLYEKNSAYGLVYGRYTMKLDSGNEIVVPDGTEPDDFSGNIFARLLVKNTIGAPTILMRKEVFEKVGGFDEDMRCLEDWDFVLKVSKSYEIGFLPEVVMQASTTQGGLSSDVSGYFQNRLYLLRKYLVNYKDIGTLEQVLIDILQKAQNASVLPQVQKMMELVLKM